MLEVLSVFFGGLAAFLCAWAVILGMQARSARILKESSAKLIPMIRLHKNIYDQPEVCLDIQNEGEARAVEIEIDLSGEPIAKHKAVISRGAALEFIAPGGRKLYFLNIPTTRMGTYGVRIRYTDASGAQKDELWNLDSP